MSNRNSRSPKRNQFHVAHRKSPSDLTALMAEQLNLQRQLEVVQAQQQHILQQQQQQTMSQPAVPSLPPGSSHSRQPSYSASPSYSTHLRNVSVSGPSEPPKSHRRSQSGNLVPGQAMGHVRRHSLGLSEAKKAAAIAQSQRPGASPSRLSISNPADFMADQEEVSQTSPAPNFKFPASPSSSGSDDFELQRRKSHGRSRSLMAPPNFEFPARTENITPPPSANHERRPSNFRRTGADMNNNWRKQQQPLDSPSFVPGHRNRSSYGGSVSSFSMQQSGSGQQRKSLFAPYLPQNSLPELIDEGRLVIGTLRVNKKNRSDAYVSTDGLLDADIFICGSKDRNRALEGDLVAVELLVVDEVWLSKREKEEKKRRKDSGRPVDFNDDVRNDASTHYSSEEPKKKSSLGRKGSLKQRPTQKKNDDVEVEGQSLLLVEEEEINDDYKPLYAGHVVAVVDRIPGQLFAGTLGLLRPSQASKEKENGQSFQQQRPKIVWFKPTDKKVPLIAIPTEQAPKDFVENHEKYADQLFIASIKRWPITSLHPFGTLISQLGPMNDQKTEIDAILRDNNFLCDEYTELSDASILSELGSPNTVLSSSDFNGRRDFCSDYVVSFSPIGGISDHAMHVKRLSDTKIELGIHVSDVTFFIPQGSVLDKKAKKRSHSVFLPQKYTHLLPDAVNSAISFEEQKHNLSLSVVFQIDTTDFSVDGVWFGEGVILPRQKVDYRSVDLVLKGETSTVVSATSDYIRTLNLIAREFRRKRLENRELNNTPMLPLFDQLDDERAMLSLNIFDEMESFSTINEIFHKVNGAVAEKLLAGLGDKALLRRFAMPAPAKLEAYHEKISNLGVFVDTSTPAALENSLLNVANKETRQCIETIMSKCMSRGKYCIAGAVDPSNYFHYLFNMPLYTHFTSPSRRYADLIVHRQLKAVLFEPTSYYEDIDTLKMNSDYCNFKKDCAKQAQDQAVHLLLSQTINEMSKSAGQLLCMGIVVQVYESSFDVLIPELGIEKRVHGDQLPLKKAEFDRSGRILELYWDKGVDSATFIPADENEPLSYRASIKNKYRSSASAAASLQRKSSLRRVEESLEEKLANMNIEVPSVSLPENAQTAEDNILETYLAECKTRVEGDNYIQEVRELAKVPILLRAEIGMTLPCLTVRTLNPFATVE